MKHLLSLLIVVGFSASLFAAEPSTEDVDRFVGDYLAKRPSLGFGPNLSYETALKTQDAIVSRLSRQLGKPVGYKVGLVNKEAQQRMGASGPVLGVLLADMLLKDQAEITMKSGTQLICESDLIVVVRDEKINDAKTPLEAARSLSELVAFLEVPDMALDPSLPMNANLLTAVNVGARLGVLGKKIPMQATPEFVAALADMRVTMMDQKGQELSAGAGKAILENPLNAVIWLSRELKKSGRRLKAGDILSLGTMSKAHMPQSGQTITVRYEGLPSGPLSVSARFK